MQIKSLGATNFDKIFEAFSEAFADYEMQLNKEQLATMFKRRGFNADMSFAAFDGNKIVAFTCNGIGNFHDTPTAYDTGTGTLKEYRGQGLATRIFEHSIPYLRKKGIKQYLLEVLQHNTKAVSVYRNLGFETTREFYYGMQENENICNHIKSSSCTDYLIKPIDIEKHASIPDFWDFYPSWQNSMESVKRAGKDLISIGAFTNDQLAGYCIYEPASGDITQIAVERQHRRKGVASLLLDYAVKTNKNNAIKVINTDITCDSVTAFLQSKNIQIKGKQFEMMKRL